GTHDEDLGVGEIEELEDAVHHRVTERDQGVHEAENDAVEQYLREDTDQQFVIHALSARRPEGRGGARGGPRETCGVFRFRGGPLLRPPPPRVAPCLLGWGEPPWAAAR